jgi:hypothetical protein
MRIVTRIAALVATASMAAVVHVGAAAADDFGVRPGTFTVVSSGTENPDQAGGHPDIATRFEVSQKNPGGEASLPAGQTYGPAGTVRNVDLLLPPGLIANPQVAKICPMALVSTSQCPADTGIGETQVALMAPIPGNQNGVGRYFQRDVKKVLYRVEPTADEVAAFATTYLQFPIRIGVTVGPDGDYRVRARLTDVNETYPVIYAKVTLWGVPADHQGPTDTAPFGGPLEGAPRTAFTSMPTACDAAPQDSSLSLTSWQDNAKLAPVLASLPAATGCDALPFDPSISVKPANPNAGAPSGYAVDLSVPQPWTDPPAEGQDSPLSTAHLKDVKVVLPKGVAISPPVAGGLGACTDDELARASSAPESCPETSKIGTIKVETPLLDDPLEGSVYVGSQLSKDPESGDMYRIFLTASAPGVRLKLLGQIKADKDTGQLTATFLDNPELPFSKMSLVFKDGDRAPLVNPPTCGTFTATGTLSSWSGQSRALSSDYKIDQNCPTGQFAPSFTAGTANPFAGAFSTFVTTVGRTDADQDLSRITVALPSGLLGALGSVPLCSELNAAAGTCSADAQIGTTTVAAGSGGTPYALGGKVFLAGPYKGAPFSLSIVVDAKAGPFDLGLVVVRAPLSVNANEARATVVSDPLPQIVGGVPLHYRSVNVTLDRPGFIFNATSCQSKQIAGQFESPSGAIATPAVSYQAQGCDQLKLNPELSLQFTGPPSELSAPVGTQRKHPGVKASVSWPFGDTNLKQVKVELPLAVALDADNAQGLCTPAQAAARACPDSTIVGQATAKTQALHEALTGPIYFVEGTRQTEAGKTIPTFPKLWLKLSGEGVSLDLWADSDVNSKTQQLKTTFANIPDAPISGFTMEIKSGKGGILAGTQNVCAAKKTSVVHYEGQNGGTLTKNVAFTVPTCGPQIASAKRSANQLAVRVGGIGAGKLSVSGKGTGKASRTIKNSAAATVKAPLTRATRRKLDQGKSVKLAISVKFAPKAGKALTLKKTVTLKGKKVAKK